MIPVPVLILAAAHLIEQAAPGVAIVVAVACAGFILGGVLKAVDDRFSAGAAQRQKNRRTDAKASLYLLRFRR